MMSETKRSSTRIYPTYRPRLPWAWWQNNTNYKVYMLRELSSVFVAIWSWRFIAQLKSLRQGPDAYARFVEGQRRPGWVLFNAVALGFAVLHAVTWFQLSGVVMSGIAQRVRVGGRAISAEQITAGSFANWAAASLTIALGLLFGGRNSKE